MKIIPHRGCWTEPSEGNSLEALTEALRSFDGIEFDVRDGASDIVIAHDPFIGRHVPFDDFLRNLGHQEREKFFAINVKADGLGNRLKEILRENGVDNYMCFDLSFPEKRSYEKLGLRVFDRLSDFEFQPDLNSSGLVVDCFEKDFDLSHLHSVSAPLFFISPELHKRNHLEFWKHLRLSTHNSGLNYICTDKPFAFREIFND